jgi:rod shape-determining protein MreD
MTIFFIEQVPLGLTLIQMIMSILCYPLVVLFAWAFLGLRKAAPGDLNALGGRP